MAALAIFLSTIAATSDASAGSRLCRQLEGQLAALSSSRGAGGGAQAGRYEQAIAAQRQQIDKLRADQRRAGCGGTAIGGSLPHCSGLDVTLARMEKNLAELRRTHARLSGGRDNRRERARVIAALGANDCRQAPPARKTSAERRENAGVRIVDGSNAPAAKLAGNYRTMCVRACDGYYFPISYSVSTPAFERDARACAAMCPGTKVELYAHRVPGEESEDMVSTNTGIPYREMPNAFLYRDAGATRAQACGCGRMAQGYEVIGGGERSASAPDGEAANGRQSSFYVAPAPGSPSQPAPGDGPAVGIQAGETLSLPPREEVDAERRVRVVGPAFLPGPEEAIDLRAPARIPSP